MVLFEGIGDKNKPKELSFYHNLKFSNLYIFESRCHRPFIFQTIISLRSNNLRWKYQMVTPSGCKDIGIRKF